MRRPELRRALGGRRSAPGRGRPGGLRRSILALAATFLLAVTGASLVAPMRTTIQAVSANPAASVSRPNIVLITSDDQRIRDMAVMPQLRRLLTRPGTRFANSISPTPLCCPARASILTGQYAHNHGVLSNRAPWGGYQVFRDSGAQADTLPLWLRKTGYFTAFLGKYLNGYGVDRPHQVPRGWSSWTATTDPGMFDYRNFQVNHNGHLVELRHRYQTDYYARVAERLVERRAPSNQPFFFWASFIAPHYGNPAEPDDPPVIGDRRLFRTPAIAHRHQDAFAGAPHPPHPAYDEADVSDKSALLPRWSLLTDTEKDWVDEVHQQRLESLLALDQAVAGIVAALKASGELGNTLVIYTTDNGFLLGEHGVVAEKLFPYEPSIRTPLILRGLGVPAGAVRTQPAATIDIAPTIADAAGVRPPIVSDGVSLLRLARDPSARARRPLVLETGPRTRRTSAMFYQGVRTRRWVYVEYHNGGRELYDLAGDRFELRSVHADPAARPVRARLTALLDRLADCAGRSCR